jgi:hypothetical protein
MDRTPHCDQLVQHFETMTSATIPSMIFRWPGAVAFLVSALAKILKSYDVATFDRHAQRERGRRSFIPHAKFSRKKPAPFG